MPGNSTYSPYLIIGKLSQDYILTEEGLDLNNIPGGHLLYAAIGMTPWEKHPGIVSRVGSNYPPEFIQNFAKYDIDTGGIKVLPIPIEHRNFITYFEPEDTKEFREKHRQSVLTEYFHAGKPFPKDLLGYVPSKNNIDSLTERKPETILSRDIPPAMLEARCVHICPMDYISHNLLPQAFSGERKKTITIQTGDGYMQPFFFESIKTLVNGLSALITRERQVRSLFSEKYLITDVGDMLKIMLGYGCINIFWFVSTFWIF